MKNYKNIYPKTTSPSLTAGPCGFVQEFLHIKLTLVCHCLQALNIETEEDIHLLASYFMHLRGKPDPGEEEKVSNDLKPL